MTERAVPAVITQFTRKNNFRAWLEANGSAILATTNPYEVLRFQTPEGVGVIYSDRGGRLSYTGGAREALAAFLNSQAWRCGPRTTRRGGQRRRAHLIATIAERDGWGCCYCGNELTEETATIEHVVARTFNGPDHPANIVLAHQQCNAAAAHLSVRAKIELAIERRTRRPGKEAE